MKNSLWKLTALAGVVGIVMLAFLQAQHGLNSPDPDEFVPVDTDELTAAPEFGVEGSVESFAGIPEHPLGGPDDGFSGDGFSDDGFPTDPDSASFAVGDDTAGRRTARVDPSEGIRPDEDDPWGADDDPPGAPVARDDERPIRRRDPAVRPVAATEEDGFPTADRVQPADGEDDGSPGILRVAGDETLQPVPDAALDDDDFGPDLFRDQPVPSGTDSPEADFPADDPLPAGDPTPRRSAATDDEFPPLEDDGFPPLEDDGFPSPEDEPADTAASPPNPTLGEPAFDPAEFTTDPPAMKADDAEADGTFDPESFDAGPFEDDGFPTEPKPEPTPEPTDRDTDPVPDLRPMPDAFGDDGPSFEADEPTDPRPEPRALDFEDRDPSPRRTIDPEPTPAEPSRGDFRVEEADPEPLVIEADPERVTPPPDAGRVERSDLIGDATLDASAPTAPQKPRLTIEKVAPEVAVLGKPIVYTIVVRNIGETPAQKVVVEDLIPKGTELTGTIPRAELVDKTLRWKLGTVAAGETKKIAVRVMPIEEGQIGSIATVNFVATVGARTRVMSPKLRFTMTAPKKAALGKPVAFQFDVVNNGDGPATGIVVRDLVPAGLHHPGGDDLEYTIGDLGPGERKSVTLSLTAKQVGDVVNRAVARADGGVEVEAKTTVRVVGASLDVSRTGPSKRYVGRSGTYTNVVVNNGEAPVAGITVVETLPEGVVFVEAGSGGQYNAQRREVAWRIERLGPKESTVLKVKLASRVSGTFASKVTATADSGATASVTSEAEAIGFTALGLDIEGGGPPVFVGDTVTFKVAAGNRGSSNAANVAVTVQVSPELELASVNAPVKYSRAANEIRFTPVPTLGGRATASFELTFRAVKPGDGRIRAHIDADDLSKPLQQDESVRVVAEAP